MPYPFTNPGRDRGFTLVEAAVVTIAVVALLAILIPILREQHEKREQQRVQALAESEPWEVFEFRAEHVIDPRTAHGGYVAVRCEFVNTTDYPLTLPKDSAGYVLVIGGTNYVASSQVLHSPNIVATPIAPGESLTFDSGFFPYFMGPAQIRVVYLVGDTPEEVDLNFSTNDPEDDRRFSSRSMTYGVLPARENRFQSNVFRLGAELVEGSIVPTADEVIARMKLIR